MKRLATLASITSLALIVGNQTAIAAPMQNNQFAIQIAACDSILCANKVIAKQHDSNDFRSMKVKTKGHVLYKIVTKETFKSHYHAGIKLKKGDFSKGAFITKTTKPMKPSVVKSKKNHKENTTHKTITNNNFSFVVKSGSLKENVERFAKTFNYTVAWKVIDLESGLKADYNWIGNERITEKSDLGILNNILKPYKLNTTVWNGNRVICISNTSACKK